MEKKKKLVIMCGAPGLGKSTFIQNHRAGLGQSYKIVSRDEIRFSLVKENEEYFSHEDEVWETFISQINNGLHDKDITIADATHLNRNSRQKLLNALDQDCLKDAEIIAIVMRSSLKKALTQNENRKGTRSYVPESAIRNMYNSFTMPKKNEGFDRIFTVTDGLLVERMEL